MIKIIDIKRKPNFYGAWGQNPLIGSPVASHKGITGHPAHGVWPHTPHNHLVFSLVNNSM